MNTALSHRRCFNHPTREASARCPECARFYCRECVTDHDDRVICSNCLKRAMAETGKTRRRGAVAEAALRLVCGVVLAWLFFRAIGGMLLGVPTEYHDGEYWNEAVMEQTGNFF